MSGTDLASMGATGGMTGSCMRLIVADDTDVPARRGRWPFRWVDPCTGRQGARPILDRCPRTDASLDPANTLRRVCAGDIEEEAVRAAGRNDRCVHQIVEHRARVGDPGG